LNKIKSAQHQVQSLITIPWRWTDLNCQIIFWSRYRKALTTKSISFASDQFVQIGVVLHLQSLITIPTFYQSSHSFNIPTTNSTIPTTSFLILSYHTNFPSTWTTPHIFLHKRHPILLPLQTQYLPHQTTTTITKSNPSSSMNCSKLKWQNQHCPTRHPIWIIIPFFWLSQCARLQHISPSFKNRSHHRQQRLHSFQSTLWWLHEPWNGSCCHVPWEKTSSTWRLGALCYVTHRSMFFRGLDKCWTLIPSSNYYGVCKGRIYAVNLSGQTVVVGPESVQLAAQQVVLCRGMLSSLFHFVLACSRGGFCLGVVGLILVRLCLHLVSG
jgi:hypothetical protein